MKYTFLRNVRRVVWSGAFIAVFGVCMFSTFPHQAVHAANDHIVTIYHDDQQQVIASDAQTVGTSADCSTVYAMQFGEGGLSGLSAPGGLTVERVGSLETKDASRVRVKWYAGLALFNTVKLAKLTGVRV